MIKKASKYYHTLKYLKAIQWRYRLYYTFRNKLRGYTAFKNTECNLEVQKLTLTDSVPANKSCSGSKFSFLNLETDFGSKIDWDFADYGKLWTYNLNYFDFLHQEGMDKASGLKLILEFIQSQEKIQVAFEPYPISLRTINWIKFIAKHSLDETLEPSVLKRIHNSLWAQYAILLKNLEYQHLANHLIENGFALLFGAYYFNSTKLYRKAKSILSKELEEQIMNDGAHFELSPMYHQIILFRILDGYNLLSQNDRFDNALKETFYDKASKMLAFLKQVTYQNGNIPFFNDTTNGVAPSSEQLFAYAQRLGISPNPSVALSNSGYRKFKSSNFELIVDAGNLGGVNYNLAHSHNDMLSFELYVKSQAVLVNTGISTYEKNATRLHERQTKAHNTVTVDNREQNQVWSGHRVAQRGRCIIEEESDNRLLAYHTGYQPTIHKRQFRTDQHLISIQDQILGKHNIAKAYFHFHPEIPIRQEKNKIFFNSGYLEFDDYQNIALSHYQYAEQFNLKKEAQVVEVSFVENLNTQIHLT